MLPPRTPSHAAARSAHRARTERTASGQRAAGSAARLAPVRGGPLAARLAIPARSDALRSVGAPRPSLGLRSGRPRRSFRPCAPAVCPRPRSFVVVVAGGSPRASRACARPVASPRVALPSPPPPLSLRRVPPAGARAVGLRPAPLSTASGRLRPCLPLSGHRTGRGGYGTAAYSPHPGASLRCRPPLP